MDDFLFDLYWFCTEHIRPPELTPERRAARERLKDLERRLREHMGAGFLLDYEEALQQYNRWVVPEIFRAGLCFGARFQLEALRKDV